LLKWHLCFDRISDAQAKSIAGAFVKAEVVQGSLAFSEFISGDFFTSTRGASTMSNIIVKKYKEKVEGSAIDGNLMSNIGTISRCLTLSSTVSDTSFLISLGKFGIDQLCEFARTHMFKQYLTVDDVVELAESLVARLFVPKLSKDDFRNPPPLKKMRSTVSKRGNKGNNGNSILVSFQQPTILGIPLVR
jgi:hypothetical protein